MTTVPIRTLLTAVLVLSVAACATSGATDDPAASGTPSPGAPSSGPSVVVTTTILGDVVDQLVDDAAQVEVLLPRGADTHGYTPSAAEAQAVRQADLVVANGGGLEEGLLDALEAAESDGVHVFHALEHVEGLAAGEAAHDHEDEPGHEDEADHETEADHGGEAAHEGEEGHEGEADHEDEAGHDHEGGDPHFWMDPLRMAAVVEALAVDLTEVAPDVDWDARADALVAELEEVDAEVVEILDAVPEDRRLLVTNHDAFGYLADRYGFDVVATVIPGSTTLAEPSAADLEEVVDAVREAGVPAIFAETSAASGLADAVADEVGQDVEVVSLFTESLSEEGGPADTYQAYLRTNATAIADALG